MFTRVVQVSPLASEKNDSGRVFEQDLNSQYRYWHTRMESLKVFRNFKLDGLSEDWISSVWDAEFTTYDELPDRYLEYLGSEDMRLLLHKSRLVLKTWIAVNCERETPSEFSWQDLMILNINVRGLLAVLGYIMKSGQCATTDKASRQACLEATSLYFMFLTVPGSNVFHVYHPNLYQRALETLKISESLFSHRNKNDKGISDPMSSNMDNKLSDYCVLSYSEKLKLVKELDGIISDLIAMLKLFRFKEHMDSLDVTIRILLDITRLEIYAKYHNGNATTDYGITSLSRNAFTALQELCSSNHGTIALTIMLIVQYMFPYLLFHHSSMQSKTVTVVHETAIYFLKSLLKIHEKETAQSIVALMHQLMIKCPERLDGRQRQAAVIIKLLNICSQDVVMSIFNDVILFSYSGKISHRLFAQEILSKLLTESSLSNNNLDEDAQMKIRRILIAAVLSRCVDRSPLVRGKAMATLAIFSDCSNDIDKNILVSMFEATTEFNRTLPVLDDLKRALSENSDALPESNALVTMLLDRVSDERALVRRSALKILRNLSIMFPPLASKMTRIISERCRDPTMMVRQFAVQVLSEILEQYPHDSRLLDDWVQAVMPQIYDIESKVQEKVLECLESVLIGRITNVSVYTPDAVDSLPWRLLDKLSSMRMRKHLSKACSLWVKNGIITKTVISNIQSHVGNDNTVSAWILLAALAENMKIPSLSKYIADYKEVIRKNDFHASLLLHVLRHSWPVLDREYLEDLYQHIYECVCRFEINFNLISICLDVLNGVLRRLHGDGSDSLIESNMAKLIRLAEVKIRDILEVSESCTEDTLKMRAIFTLGHASLLCTSSISSSTLRTLERLLLQWESLPQAVREIKDLQASVVVLLCQQALRDREIAKLVTPILGNLMRQETNLDTLARTAVKINAAKALADICVRFTALVEPYLPDMCVSMKDSNPAVREAIVVIFIQLLLEDFIKVKGPFFFHILTMLSDTDSMIRELTMFLVEERLLVKNKNLIPQQFLESIYHYNNYRSRNTFRGHKMHEREKKLFTLPGRANRDKRNVIYEFMIEHLDPPAKLQIVFKLTKYILHEICDGDSIDITTEEGACVLSDALYIMSNNRLQAAALVEKHKDDMPELDETATSSSTPNNNAANVLIAGMKRHNLDNLLPTLIMLKKKLIALKSALKDELERLLFKIYSDYEKEHLIVLLNEYPELEKDMERYRRLKDKATSESDDCINGSPSCVINHKDALELCKRTTVRVLVERLSFSSISDYKNDGSDSSNHLRVYTTPHETPTKPSRPRKSSPAKSPLRFRSSTPISFLDLNLDSSVSPTRALRIKRPSSEQEISPVSPRRKVLKTSMN